MNLTIKRVNASELPETFFAYTERDDIEVVRDIIREVKINGDNAVRKYTSAFDKINLKELEVSKKEMDEAFKQVDQKTIAALRYAARRIKMFAQKQMRCFKNFKCTDRGIILGQKVVPMQKVGCYVPGGRYPLISSALMSIIPARVAGVSEIYVCSPRIQPATIVAAKIAGADKMFNIGGAQAIAAMAYGTETIPRVDKIVGPGNTYVTAAKKEVYGSVGIDFIAGPSEIMILADDTANPQYIAADLLAQAEHDIDAVAVLVTTSIRIARAVQKELEIQILTLPTREIAQKSLENNGYIILVPTMAAAIALANKKAPEHLSVQVKNLSRIMPLLKNYGSLFLGNDMSEVFGDYCSGTNHILPTNGAARYSGGLSVREFIKVVTYQSCPDTSIQTLIPLTARLAREEGLIAHARAAEIRKNL